MKCPHCLEGFHADLQTRRQIEDKDGVWEVHSTVCPSCKRATILVTTKKTAENTPYREIRAWPKEVVRPPLPPEVVEPYASDYYEACLILADSPRASAALSRLCLQALLREKAGVSRADLSSEINQALASKTLPPELGSMMDGIRDVGDFAAHPLKSTNPGLVLDVELGEAEYVLDVLGGFFDFYLVRPAQLKEKHDALKEKPAESDLSSQGNTRSVRRIVTSISAASRD